MNRSRTSWILGGLLLGGTALALSACASTPRSSTGSPESAPGEMSGPPLPYGPLPGEPVSAMGPEPVSVHPIVLVLGPGAARGYAYAGVLRALSDAKIPVAAIVGSDTGALIGALYGLTPSINGFEWKLQQLKGDLFENKASGLGSLFKRGNPRARVSSRLKELFAGKDLRDSRVPLKVLTSLAALQDSGDAANTVSETLVVPPARMEGALTSPKAFPVAEAKALGLGPVVVVDVLDRLEEPRGQAGESEQALRDAFRLSASQSVSELSQADLVIRPDLSKIRFSDFERRSDAVYEGKTAAQGVLKELRDLTGGSAKR